MRESKRLASSGSCSRMSSDPTKMASEAHPLGLHLHPHLDDLGDGAHLPLPLLRELEERRAEARAHHLVLEGLHELLVGLEHQATLLVAFEVLDDLEGLQAPRVGNLVDAVLVVRRI